MIPIKGDEAREKMHDILHDYPEAVKLADEVCEFYGSWLELILEPTAPSSGFSVGSPPDGTTFVEILLKTKTDREADGLIHELLHAWLLIQGFPYYEPVNVNQMSGWNTKKPVPQLINCVHHDLMFHKFVSLGFRGNRFLDRSEDTPPDYERAVHEAKPNELGFWCFMYYSNWQSWRLAEEEDSWKQIYERHMNEVIYYGKARFPELLTVKDEIQRWFDQGEFTQPGYAFSEAFDKLTNIMHLPRIDYAAWYVMERSQPYPRIHWLWSSDEY